ncbi:Similar to Inositol polyphosphate multikinase; acc. no. P07250 [Pyronema omphalodes CBS 100304]|uniref:Kinase n=1 Tax=Pyronema omphalodes (strain CBS 100304) TaxID=1076935 RepID=U4LK36_PYROM|nr:Similar to Inositol polyphosphate multikinase; acc. no. P07250 [Pyronema omphalodes CBS 100304]
MPTDIPTGAFKCFEKAAAGHAGVLTDESGSLLIKPCTSAEASFYDSCLGHPSFASWMPKYIGTVTLNNPETSIPIPSTANTGSKPSTLETGLVLQNLTHGFTKPCILDIKLGCRLWDDFTPQEKRDRLDQVAKESTSASLHWRVAGMRVYKPADKAAILGSEGKLKYVEVQEEEGGNGVYWGFNKLYGRKAIQEENVAEAVMEFLDSGLNREQKRGLLRRWIEKLQGITEMLEEEESRMYSASLLFVYEGDEEAFEKASEYEKILDQEIQRKKERERLRMEKEQNEEEEDEEEEEEEDEDPEDDENFKVVEHLKLIDFAHATWTPGQGPDENALKGVRNVNKLFGEVLEQI